MKNHLTKITSLNFQVIFFIVCCVFYASSYMGRLNYSAAMVHFTSDGILTPSTAGLISTLYYFTYGAGQIVSGILGDKFSARYIPFIGVCLSALCNILMAVVTPGVIFAVIWGINGFAQSLLWPSVMRTLVLYFPLETHLKVFAYITTAVPVGTLSSYLLSGLLLRHFDVKSLFIVPALIMVAVGAVFVLLYPKNRPLSRSSEFQNDNALNSQPLKKNSIGVIAIMTTPIVLIMMFPSFSHGFIKDGLTAWIPSYINSIFNSGSATAVLVTAVLPIVNLAGVYVLTKLKRRITNNITLCAISFAISFVAMLMLTLIGGVNLWLSLMLLALCSSSMMAINTVFVSYIPALFAKQGRVAFVSGAMNSLSYMGAAVSGFLIGWLTEQYSWTVTMAFFTVLLAATTVVCLIYHKKDFIE